MLYPEAKLIVFAKAPEPGKSKTRLIPALGEQGAAELHKRMLQHIINTVFDAGFCNIELQCYPDSRHAFFLQLLEQRCIELNPQQGQDLGQRMAHALQQALAHHRYAIVIGSDAPGLSAGYIKQALDQLAAGCDVVLGPAIDGGYVLIGLTRFNNNIFSDIDWGTERVMQQTLEKIRQLNMSVQQLPTLWDVDTAADLEYLRNQPQLVNMLIDL